MQRTQSLPSFGAPMAPYLPPYTQTYALENLAMMRIAYTVWCRRAALASALALFN